MTAGRYPAAAWRPLGTQSEPLITPRILVFHTMVGTLRSSEALFRQDGYTGVEAHFGVGGPWDGAALDGAVWQWQSIDRQADAQAGGNPYCVSIETSDGGDPDRAWSARQIEALIELAVWFCQQTGAPARLVSGTGDHGFGYHRQFATWNPQGHTCPNPTRQRQLQAIVIPRVAQRLSGDDMPITTEDAKLIARTLLSTQPTGTPGITVGIAAERAATGIPAIMHVLSHLNERLDALPTVEQIVAAVVPAVVAALPAGSGVSVEQLRVAVEAGVRSALRSIPAA